MSATACTVKLVVAAGVVPQVVVIERVEVTLANWTGLGLNEALAPAGRAVVTVRAAVSLPPPCDVKLMV